MRCGFCGGSMQVQPKVDGMVGETGGLWWKEELACSTCAAVVVHDVMEKIGSLRESWRIQIPPTNATAVTELHCPACEALLASACPTEVRPAPVTTFAADRPGSADRSTDHLCVGCGARYVLEERVQVSWRNAESSTPIASPLPYTRSR